MTALGLRGGFCPRLIWRWRARIWRWRRRSGASFRAISAGASERHRLPAAISRPCPRFTTTPLGGRAAITGVTPSHSSSRPRARPFFFSLHASDPKDPDGGSRRDVGHTFLCGPTGGGKTVIIGFLISMLTKFACTQVIIDKDRGLEILVRALGGEYLPLKNGIPTGCNPLQLPPTPANVDFLKSWLRLLAQNGQGPAILPVREESDLELALRGTLALDLSERRLSRLIEFLDPTTVDGVYARLSPWCHLTTGDYAWAFDNPKDLIVPRLAANSLIGFDCTDQINHLGIRTPMTAYLLHV